MASNSTYSALADLGLPFVPPPVSGLTDNELIEAQRSVAEVRRRTDATAAVIAAEIGRRSARELGYDGLAQRLGARTPELLVQRIAGTSSREARSLVRVGGLMDSPEPWLSGVAQAVTGGTLSVESADAMAVGLGVPSTDVPEAALAGAATKLLAEAPGLTLERVGARARELRSDLDLDFVRDRETAMREQSYARLTLRPDGMTLLTALLDPERAAFFVAAFDAATSPRRGGPRFVDPKSIARAERIVADERTTDQLALEALTELLRLGMSVDDGEVLGSHAPEVHILVTDRDLRQRRGVGYLEGSGELVSIETVERHACATGAIPIRFEGKQVVDVGRAKRFFNRRQRRALAARDGGCRFPGCGRPPSWTEAHHINEWSKGGLTDVRDGILLCRYHHLLLHNNGWQAVRRGDDYYFVPPSSIDATRTPVLSPSRSGAACRLAATG